MKEACHVIRGAGQGTYADYALDACFLEGLPARSFVDALVVLPSTLQHGTRRQKELFLCAHGDSFSIRRALDDWPADELVSSLSLSNYAALHMLILCRIDWRVCVWVSGCEHAWSSCDSVASPLGRWDRLASVSRSWAPAACLAHPGSCCFPHPPLWACKGCIWKKEKRQDQPLVCRRWRRIIMLVREKFLL